MAPRGRRKKPPPSAIDAFKPSDVARDATGTDNPVLQERLLQQVYDSLWLPEGLNEDERKARIQSAIYMLQGIGPADQVEGMLATQMVATHNAVLECLRRAMIPTQSLQGRDQNLKHATKLLTIYTRQIDVLNKHRGKGHQKVTVEYVNVEAGGQAVVGHVETGKAATPRPKASNRK